MLLAAIVYLQYPTQFHLWSENNARSKRSIIAQITNHTLSKQKAWVKRPLLPESFKTNYKSLWQCCQRFSDQTLLERLILLGKQAQVLRHSSKSRYDTSAFFKISRNPSSIEAGHMRFNRYNPNRPGCDTKQTRTYLKIFTSQLRCYATMNHTPMR